MAETQIPQQHVQLTVDELYRQKGEIVTQLEICQGRLQIINQQIQSFLSQPQPGK